MTLSVGLAKRLTVPDDFFVLSQSLSYQHYDLNNYNTGLFTFGDGTSRNFAYTVGLTRSNKGVNPIFPTYGSEFSISAKLTPPYSLLNGTDYATLGDKEEYKLKNKEDLKDVAGNIILEKGAYLDAQGNKVGTYQEAAADAALVDQKKFNWLEYYKIKFKADWYTKIYGKLVLRTLTEFGFLGAYNQDRGVVPFERFYLGGDGQANYSMDGRETVQLRGYKNNSLTPSNSNGDQIGATVYNKFSLEMRYPITLKSSASIYALAFLEAGSSYKDFKSYDPFALSRSAGVGLRVFMPAFGLLGIDFAHGFDPVGDNLQSVHFIIGQQF